MHKIGVVILNWNSADDTINCARSVLDVCGRECELVIVDNGSCDDSVDKIKNEFDGIVILETKVNLGYAGGNNRGLCEIFSRGCDYGLILNNDCTLLCKNAFEDIFANADAKIAIFGLGISEKDGRGRLGFHNFNKDYFGILLGFHEQINGALKGERFTQVDRVSGAGMVVTKRFFESIGAIDERYFLYCEEVDYCLKARVHGWAVVYEAADIVSVTHSRKGVYERPYVWYYMYRNMILFCKFNFNSNRLYFALLLCLVSQLKGLIYALLQGRFAVITMMIKGFRDGLLGRTGIMR